MGSCIRLRLSSSQALPLNQQVNASLWGRERELGVMGWGLVILGFQPIYKVCIVNYLTTMCRFAPLHLQHAIKASRTWWGWGVGMMTEGVNDSIMPGRIMLLSWFSVSLFPPSLPPLTFSLSLSPSIFLLFLASSLLTICLVILTPSLFTSPHSVFCCLSLSVVLFFILSFFCLPPLF